MKAVGCLICITATLLAGACERSSLAGSESLVGAKSPPSMQELSAETIQINRRGGPRNEHMLTYDLYPSNSLTVAHTVDELGGTKALATATFHLAPEAANQVRTLLWRVRPARLTGIEDITLPTGCTVVIDASPQANVVFADTKQRLGISSIPRERDCDTPQARQARQLVSIAVASLPGRNLAAQFPN
jgi:hypothetical protein